MRVARGALLLAVVVLAACVVRQSSVDDLPAGRQAVDAPERFLVDTPSGAEEPSDDGTCRSPMIDPRDGTRLALVRSASGRGDYTVPAGRYGVGARELLRLDCATGRPLGIVAR